MAELPYRQSITAVLAEQLGPHGLTRDELTRQLTAADAALRWLRAQADQRALPLLGIHEETADIAAAEAAIAALLPGARTIVFFGTGGSGLGGKTLAQFTGWNIPGVNTASNGSRPRTRFYDNLDGHTLGQSLAKMDFETTRFVVISKSGGTVETLVQAIAALQAVKQKGLGDRIPKLFLGLTEPAIPGRANGLRTLFAEHGVPMLDHHTGIGGRFSVLSNVGLLPAIVRGLDVRALRAGAAEVVVQATGGASASDVPAALGAALVLGLKVERGIGCQVMMPYADRLASFAHWFVQLWAESLGKGGQGTTPIACLGPVDQHSQLQLFQDGPRDHLMTLLRAPTQGQGPALDPELTKLAGISFLAGRSAGDLVAAQTAAVPDALQQAGRPVRTFDVPQLDARALGALLMHFMLETILAGRMLGIDPFDQPAVELAKTLARERLAKG